MKALEQLMLSAIHQAVRENSDPINAESIMGMKETVSFMSEAIDPEKMHALVIIGVKQVAPNAEGHPGIELLSNLCGSPAVLALLGRAVTTMVHMAELKSSPEAQMLEAIFGAASLQSEKCEDRFSSAGKSKQ